MNEKTAKPIVRNTITPPQGSTTPQDVSEATQPNHMAKDGWSYAFDDVEDKAKYEIRLGTRQPFSVAREGVPLPDLPIIKVTADAMGLSDRNSVIAHQEELGRIVDLAVGIIGNQNPDAIYQFIRHQMRRGVTGSYGHTLMSLERHLTELAQEFI